MNTKENAPEQIREEIKSILDRYSEEQIADMLRLFSLTVRYKNIFPFA